MQDGSVDNGEGSASVRDLQATYPGVSVAATTDPVFTAKGMASGAATITLTNPHGTKSIDGREDRPGQHQLTRTHEGKEARRCTS